MFVTGEEEKDGGSTWILGGGGDVHALQCESSLCLSLWGSSLLISKMGIVFQKETRAVGITCPWGVALGGTQLIGSCALAERLIISG